MLCPHCVRILRYDKCLLRCLRHSRRRTTFPHVLSHSSWLSVGDFNLPLRMNRSHRDKTWRQEWQNAVPWAEISSPVDAIFEKAVSDRDLQDKGCAALAGVLQQVYPELCFQCGFQPEN
ncbi:hypothetical protein Plhal304r1_c021g0073471 [Plasmopara halstedii]